MGTVMVGVTITGGTTAVVVVVVAAVVVVVIGAVVRQSHYLFISWTSFKELN